MANKCEICGKGPHSGYTIKRRGLAKSKGGVGRKTTGHTKHVFNPNLQSIKTLVDGSVKRLTLCSKCLRNNKLVKVA